MPGSDGGKGSLRTFVVSILGLAPVGVVSVMMLLQFLGVMTY